MQTIHISYINIRTCKLKNNTVKTLKTFVDNKFSYWFVDNKLSIHFGEDKTKSILFASKRRANNIRQLNVKYKDINIKQHVEVTYLGCVPDNMMSGEPMTLNL